MTSTYWQLVEVAARLLERGEREVVLGDLQEVGEGAWQGLLDVLGLIVHRQMLLWKNWQPWLASFGLAVPCSLLLMGVSVSLSLMFERLLGHGVFVGSSQVIYTSLFQLLSCGVLLIACSWSCGFVVGSISRRTLWVSIVSSCVPCVFCFLRFREPSLSRICLFVFLLPTVWGVRHALRSARIYLPFAILLAVAISALVIFPLSGKSACTLSWALVWPAWYIVATSRRAEDLLNTVE